MSDFCKAGFFSAPAIPCTPAAVTVPANNLLKFRLFIALPLLLSHHNPGTAWNFRDR